ncbi:ABC transporter permease [Hamadaea tsunoensis]|uniref:ABC transporter permease n=1 Tax=Hamadaea tsunoensis TaxID=53368 RepID=UPI0004182A7A|nr:ABC transporter permease [Hamadaea tsunoensis]
MKHVFRHALAHARDTMRMPIYWIPALFFPLLFFVLFGYTTAHRLSQLGLGSEYVITPFLLFTTLNVTLVSLSAGVAADRENPWESRLRVLPIPSLTRFAGRLFYILTFNLVSWIPLLTLASFTTTIKLPLYLWPAWLGGVLLGSIPFGLLGMAIGYRFAPQAAMMIANIIFMLFAFLGGLFLPSDQLPKAVQPIVPFLPTHEYQQIVLTIIGRADRITSPGWTMAVLGAWTLLFALLARTAFRRDEGVRYG